MTVNMVTGEIVELDAAAAERRAERINLRLEAIAENYRLVLPMIREAIEKRDDVALGYRSVGEYVSDRFGGALTNLGVDVRRAVVGELTQAGMSTRAIAPVVGVDQKTVVRDIHRGEAHASPVTSVTPASVPISVADEEAIEPTGVRVLADDSSVSDQPEGAVASPPPPSVTGIDGKTYTRREQARPRPDAEIYLNHIESLADQAARDAKNLTADQIRRVRPKADLWTVGLRKSIEALQDLVNSLDPEEPK